MITIAFVNTQNSIVIDTVWYCEKTTNFEFDDGNELKITICYKEVKDSGEKTITVIKLGDKQSRVGDSIGEHYDPMEDLSTTLDTIIETMFPEESQITRNNLSGQIFKKVDDVINDGEMEFKQ